MKKRYGLRVVRNLLITALLAVLMWMAADYPLPTEMGFRRAERQNLADRSEIVWTYRGTSSGDRDLLVGLTADAVHTYAHDYRFYVWPRRDGGTLVPLPDRTRYQDSSGSYLGPSFLVPDPPARAATACLTVTLDVNNWREDYVATANLTGGIFFFQMERKHHLPEDPTSAEAALYSNEDAAFSISYYRDLQNFANLPYTLEFFDPSGTLLETVRQDGWLADANTAS